MIPNQPIREGIAYHAGVLSPEDFGCKGEYVARSQGVYEGNGVFSDTLFKFEKQHEGWTFWQDGATVRTIVSVDAVTGKATITPAPYGTTDINWRIRGQDDTPFMQACFDAASPDYGSTTTYDEPATPLNGATDMGKVVLLTPGMIYPVSLSQAEFNAGKRSAIVMRRRTGVATAFLPTSPHGSFIVQTPRSYGKVISNRDTSCYTDFISLCGFTINCDGDFSGNSDNAVHIETPYGNYSKVDPFSFFSNVTVERSNGLAFHLQGKGELKTRDCNGFSCKNGGMLLRGQYDITVYGGQFGGCGKTGIRVEGPGPCQIHGVKAYYIGSNGGSNDEDCAGIVIDTLGGDIYAKGAYLSQVQTQETRGTGIIIKIRECQVVACQFLDPNRNGIGAAGGRPADIAGIHLKGPYACNNYIQAHVGMTLTTYSTPNWPADTHVIKIDGDTPFVNANGGPQANRGYISYPVTVKNPGNVDFLGLTVSGTGAILFGGGTTNGKNTGLLVNGTALT